MKVGFFGGKFLPLHMGHIYTLINASTQVDKLYFILFSSEKRDRYFCQRDGIKYIPPKERLRWMGEVVGDLDHIEVLHLEDDNQGRTDGDYYDWESGTKQVKEAIPNLTHIFGGADGYPFEEMYPGVKVNMIERVDDMSATKIRQEGIYKHWDYLPKPVQRYFVKTIAIVGTESCGKSTLVKNLAKFYNTDYVEEVGRTYCEVRKDQLTKELFEEIAMEHLLKVRKAKETANKVLFVDTEAVVTKYYSYHYEGMGDVNITDQLIRIQKYDLIIMLTPEVEWVDDGLRFMGDEEQRRKNHKDLKTIFRAYNVPFVEVGGDNYFSRYRETQRLVDLFLTDGNH